MKKQNWRIFYPILLGSYAAVGLVGVNISQMFLSAGLRSVVITVLFSVGVYALFSWREKDEHKAALLCAWFLLFFFAYGHVYGSVEGMKVIGVVVGRHRYLFPLWVVVFAVGGWWIHVRVKPTKSLSRILNMASILLLVIPLIQIVYFEWQRYRLSPAEEPTAVSSQPGGTAATSQLPDVYYMILDGYSRADVLKQNYQLDISGFLEQLRAIGFYVVPCSQSNYGVTDLSLASSLNMDYIENVMPANKADQAEWVSLGEPIRHSKVRQIFTSMGYETVAFESGVWWSEMQDADVYITSSTRTARLAYDFWHANDFELLFIRTTVLRLTEEIGTAWFGSFFDAPARGHAQQILNILNGIKTVPDLPGSKFTFIHLMAPHEPYVFSPEGDYVLTKEANPGYPNQIQFLNTQLVPIVQTILAKSTVPPIIILQSDHGRDTEFRLANFIAIYLPDGGREALYPTLTPVNLFRLVFDNYFGKDYPLLPDHSFYSSYDDYYHFTEVNYPCNP